MGVNGGGRGAYLSWAMRRPRTARKEMACETEARTDKNIARNTYVAERAECGSGLGSGKGQSG